MKISIASLQGDCSGIATDPSMAEKGIGSDGDLAPNLGGRKFFRGPRFCITFFGKNFHFQGKNF